MFVDVLYLNSIPSFEGLNFQNMRKVSKIRAPMNLFAKTSYTIKSKQNLHVQQQLRIHTVFCRIRPNL